MKFRTSAPAVLCAAVIGVVTAVSLLSYAISHRMVDEFEKTRFSQMGEITRSKFQDAEAKAISTAETIASMPQVQKAMVEKTGPICWPPPARLLPCSRTSTACARKTFTSRRQKPFCA